MVEYLNAVVFASRTLASGLSRHHHAVLCPDIQVKLKIDYHGFLTIALEGRGTACDKVREYLLAMEKKARVDTIVYETTGMDTAWYMERQALLDCNRDC